MNVGAIMDCKAVDDAGTVDIGSGCTFIMNGGTIGNCRADDDGGAVFIKQRGTFELNGGVIQNCSAGVDGGAVNIYQDGRFTMTGGTIKSCKVDLGGIGNAVYGSNDKAVVTMTGGTFEDCGAFPYSFDVFTVTFDSDGGSAVSEQKLRNAPAIKPADPKKNGYDFAGWYLGDMQYTFDSDVAANITLKAHWMPTATPTAVTAATIENVKFNYQSGDAPQATATVAAADGDKYEIAYECWQQFENNQPVAAWYSDHGSHGSLPTITAFESGKSYVYSLMLMPKDGYSFTSETVITVNGQKVSAPFVGGSMYIPSVQTITMPAVTVIDVVEINGVTVSFTDGDKPVFTGKVPDGANYAYRCEWWELDSKTGAMSTDFGNFYENKFTAFEAGKTYHYGVYVATIYGDRYVFGPDTKLKINGEFVNYKRYEGDTSDGSDGTMWVLTDLTMTPQASGTTPEYKITEGANGAWTQNSDGTLKFVANGDFSKFTGVKVDGTLIAADKYTAVSGSTVVTLKKDYLSTLSVGKHTLTIVYNDGECSTEFDIKAAQSGGSTADKPKPPQTGDNSSLTLWVALLFISGGAVIGATVVSKKKKHSI